MNHLSAAGFVLPPVYIGIPLFVLAQGRPGIYPGHPWDEKGLQRQESVGLLVGI